MKFLLKQFSLYCLPALLLSSCKQQKDNADAYGNFEATEVMVASQVAGPIIYFNVEEGSQLKAGDVVGIIDTVPLVLKRSQLFAQREGISSKNKNIVAQIDVLTQQKNNLLRDQQRIQNLVNSGSATQKQLDDVNGQLDVINKQILSVESQNSGVAAEIKSVDAQSAQLNDQIRRSYIINPIEGIVLTKFAELSEIAAPGKSLYKIADLTKMELRAYISGDQLSSVKIGEQVTVKFDTEGGKSGNTNGTISWISSSAEFTPKIVQTKEQRTNLVYAIKVAVGNKDGKIKIGMPGEVMITPMQK
ncbi:MAG TPA: HlyD family efflux transporter periplasmic adaptor subunit [Chitinophagales bacterium]|nr:HlyD family efflux transporter periplasmic adaptor subunit [Chitinophagales bacterium]